MASILTDQNTQPTPQLLSVGEKDRKRLLEVYVKRSLSLNDGSQCPLRKELRSNKSIAITESKTRDRKTRDRKHSSDTSLNLTSQASISDEDIRYEPVAEPPVDKRETLSEKISKKWRVKGSLCRDDGSNASQKSNSKPKKKFLLLAKEEGGQSTDALAPQTSTVTAGNMHSNVQENLETSTMERKDKEGKKTKKPTVWKNFLSWFSKGNSEKEQDHQRTEEQLPLSHPSTPQISCLPLGDALSKSDINLRRSKSTKKKSLHRRSLKWRRSGDMSTEKSVEMAMESTNSYYEKMSEELERIVHEVKDSPADSNATQITDQNGVNVSQEVVIENIIKLIKEQGDLINIKLKENSTITAYLNGITYRSFQQMADQYVESEVPHSKTQPPVVAPELVKFAFTLDFTARVANLHRQATGQIMGFGNQYLQDRFTHMSENHPHLFGIKAEDRKTQNSDQEFISL